MSSIMPKKPTDHHRDILQKAVRGHYKVWGRFDSFREAITKIIKGDHGRFLGPGPHLKTTLEPIPGEDNVYLLNFRSNRQTQTPAGIVSNAGSIRISGDQIVAMAEELEKVDKELHHLSETFYEKNYRDFFSYMQPNIVRNGEFWEFQIEPGKKDEVIRKLQQDFGLSLKQLLLEEIYGGYNKLYISRIDMAEALKPRPVPGSAAPTSAGDAGDEKKRREDETASGPSATKPKQ